MEFRILTAQQVLEDKPIRSGRALIKSMPVGEIRLWANLHGFEFITDNRQLFGGYWRRDGKMVNNAYEGGEYGFIC